jgi:hypothetical protein
LLPVPGRGIQVPPSRTIRPSLLAAKYGRTGATDSVRPIRPFGLEPARWVHSERSPEVAYPSKECGMPDERQDSISQGIGAPEESPSGQAAAEERARKAADAPPIGGAMGGTSDVDSPADEAQHDAAAHHEGEVDDDPAELYRETHERSAEG